MNHALTMPPRIGVLPEGARNVITDIPGVRVGHCTLNQGAIQSGVTVVCLHDRSHFLHKVPAAASVFNGFGKSVGLMQVEELGVLETPIALTNTLSVPAVAAAQIQAAIADHPDIGRESATVNPLVFECNDGYLNDIQAMAIEPTHYRQVLAGAQADFQCRVRWEQGGHVMLRTQRRDRFGIAHRAGRRRLCCRCSGAFEFWPTRQSDH